MTIFLAIFGWIVWCFVALLSLHFLLNIDRDGGFRFLMRTQGLVLAIALGVTALCDVSKLHLLWFAPLSPLIPMFITSFLEYPKYRAIGRRVAAVEVTKDLMSKYNEVWSICNDERWLFKPQSLLPCDPQTLTDAMKLLYQLQNTSDECPENAHSHHYLELSFFIPDDQFERVHAYFERFAHEKNLLSSVCRDYDAALEFLTQPSNGAAHGFFQRQFLVDAPADPDKAWVQELARKCWRGYLAQEVGWEAFVEKIESEYSFVDAEKRPGVIPQFSSPMSIP